jgi:hypothetical protein
VSTRSAIAANLALLGFLGFCAWLNAAHPNIYYVAAQEDQALEWASFWSFLLAGVLFALAARGQRRESGALPWFLAGLALFCVFVAMEEISWAQRIFGYRPPDYFLEENFQQEITIHNIAGRGLRMAVFRGIILGYGVLLPLLPLVPRARRLLERTRVVAPPLALSPSMFAILWLHLEYPWKFTGEVAECALGFGFLFAAMANVYRFRATRSRSSLLSITGLPIAVLLLAVLTAAWSQGRQASNPQVLQHAREEAQALVRDLVDLADKRGKNAVSRCNLHKRLYTFVRDYGLEDELASGEFARRVELGMPAERAEFFLDPWNYAYWIRDRCDRDNDWRVIFVYSFGPNRSRDSSRWRVKEDDIGAYVLRASER